MAACANCCTGEGGGDELGLGLLPLEARPGGMNPSISLSRHLNEYLLMTRTSLCRFCFSLPYSVTLTTYFLYQKCICSKHFFKKSIRKKIFFLKKRCAPDQIVKCELHRLIDHQKLSAFQKQQS
jgi:hypothetical protein